MMELGAESVAEHQQIIQQIGKNKWKDVVLVGGDFLKIPHPYISFSNAAEAGDWIASQNIRQYRFSGKGSRSMQMEKTIQSLLQKQ